MQRVGVTTILTVAVLPLLVHGQDNATQEIRDLGHEVSSLESRMQNLESEMSRVQDKVEDAAIVLFFFAVFCAWWAQHTGRNPWLWFFLGLFFHAITALVLLYKNGADKKATHRPDASNG